MFHLPLIFCFWRAANFLAETPVLNFCGGKLSIVSETNPTGAERLIRHYVLATERLNMYGFFGVCDSPNVSNSFSVAGIRVTPTPFQIWTRQDLGSRLGSVLDKPDMAEGVGALTSGPDCREGASSREAASAYPCMERQGNRRTCFAQKDQTQKWPLAAGTSRSILADFRFSERRGHYERLEVQESSTIPAVNLG